MSAGRSLLLSYRRADAAGTTGRIYDRLAARYGRPSVFMDVDSIPIGRDFREHIRRSLIECGVVLVVIGPRWAGPRGAARARIFDADDPVRVEVETALTHGVRVLPILVEGAMMPSASALPESLRPLATLNAARVDGGVDFHAHMSRLEHVVDALVGHDAKSSPAIGVAEAIHQLSTASARWLWGTVYALTVALPAGFALARVAPPWPDGVAVITSLVLVAGLALSAQLLHARSASRHRAALLISSTLVVVGLSAYFLGVSTFTYQVPTTHERYARGYECTEDALLLFKERCPDLGLDELQTAEYEAERLWTSGSIAVVRSSLLGVWLLSFVSIAVFVSTVRARFVQSRIEGA